MSGSVSPSKPPKNRGKQFNEEFNFEREDSMRRAKTRALQEQGLLDTDTGASFDKSFNSTLVGAGFTYGGLANYLFEQSSIRALLNNTTTENQVYRMLPRTREWLMREGNLFKTAAVLATANSVARSANKAYKAWQSGDEKAAQKGMIESVAGALGGLSAVAVLQGGTASPGLARMGTPVALLQAFSYTTSFIVNYAAYKAFSKGDEATRHKEAMDAALLNATVNWSTVGVNGFYFLDSAAKENVLRNRITEAANHAVSQAQGHFDDLFAQYADNMTEIYGRHPRILNYFAREKWTALAVAAGAGAFSWYKSNALLARAGGKPNKSLQNDAKAANYAGLITAGYGVLAAFLGPQYANKMARRGVQGILSSTAFGSTYVGMLGGAVVYFLSDYFLRKNVFNK